MKIAVGAHELAGNSLPAPAPVADNARAGVDELARRPGPFRIAVHDAEDPLATAEQIPSARSRAYGNVSG